MRLMAERMMPEQQPPAISVFDVCSRDEVMVMMMMVPVVVGVAWMVGVAWTCNFEWIGS